MPTARPKGHWPKNKHRNPEPPDWPSIRRAMDEAASRRQTILLASKIGVSRDTILRWRKRGDYPAPNRVKPITDALYALRLYRVKGAR